MYYPITVLFCLCVASAAADVSEDSRPQCPFPDESITYYPVANNCSQFWECTEGSSFLVSCPDDLVWNTVINFCDIPENVDCTLNDISTSSPAAITTDASTTPDDIPTPGPSAITIAPVCSFSDFATYYPVATNCSQFWECIQGSSFILTCPDGMAWNTLSNFCEKRENVDCSLNAVTTSNSVTTTSIATTTTPVTTTNVVTTPAPTAPPSTTAAPTQAPTQAPITASPTDSICIGQPHGTFLSNPADCTKFFECVGQKVVEFQCPSILRWNSPKLTCDYPQNVDCADTSL